MVNVLLALLLRSIGIVIILEEVLTDASLRSISTPCVHIRPQ